MGDKMTNTSTVRAAFLILASLALGCDSEGAAVKTYAPDAMLAEEAGEGPGRGGSSTVFAAPDVQAVTVPRDAGPVASPDTMPAVTPDALVLADSKPQVLADTMPVVTGIESLRACPAARVYSDSSVCTGKWVGDGKSFCIYGGQDVSKVIYGSVVKYGEDPCRSMGVSDSVSGKVLIVVIPAGACDVYCKPSN
jgi:hypothetical protein